ncbi:MAG: rhodanese family protein [Parvibaculum sp.]|nr:rhodanese family protein [Parvibaculum sp.]
MAMNTLTPLEAKKLIDQGAVVVDIREPDEFAREHIKGARNAPLTSIGQSPAHKPGDIVIYHCKSGMRTAANADKLPAQTCEAHIMTGGIEGWKAAGLGVETDKSKPIEIMRQVQIAAGSLVVTGVALGAVVHPGFYALSAFVGAGLVFAGATGYCGMANLLALMPWNRRAAI